jgi:hypothetical protein
MSTFKTLYSVFNTCHFVKIFKITTCFSLNWPSSGVNSCFLRRLLLFYSVMLVRPFVFSVCLFLVVSLPSHKQVKWLLASSAALNTRALTLVPICAYFFFSFFLFFPTFLWKHLQVVFTKILSAYNLNKHQTMYNHDVCTGPSRRANWSLYHVLYLLIEVEVEVTLRLTVSQYVLVSSTLVGLATRYYL